MSAAAPRYCKRKDIHAGCTLQRQCSHSVGHVGPCAGWQLSKKGTFMLDWCSACTTYQNTNAARGNTAASERKRALALAAAASNPSLRGITRFSDAELRLLAAACLRRPDVAPLFAHGSRPYVYAYQWTAEDAAGWDATAASLTACESKESLSHVFSANPPLQVRGPSGLRKITPDDIFYAGSGAYIIRLAISPLLCDITEIEKIIHVVLSDGDVVGFKGHVKNGGSPATQRRYVYGVSMLVIPDLAALRLVVNEKYREVYELELWSFDGRDVDGVRAQGVPLARQ